MHHVELAWSLAEAADHCLDASTRFDVYVALGAGDTYAAIRDLTRVAARGQVELAAEVVAALGAWWAIHKDPDDHYEAAHVAELRALPEPQPPQRHEPQPPQRQEPQPPQRQEPQPPQRQEPQPPPRDIKPLSINRKYLRPNRTR
jgi:hypothetical protein